MFPSVLGLGNEDEPLNTEIDCNFRMGTIHCFTRGETEAQHT